MRSYDTVILGSGFFSFGYALNSESCLIVERTQLADPNFSGTFNGFHAANGESSPLFDFFTENGLIKGTSVNAPLAESALCAYTVPYKPEILLGTDCVSVSQNGLRYDITLFNSEGFSTVSAKHVINARPPSDRRSLNLLCRGVANIQALPYSDKFSLSVSPAFYPEESILTFRFNSETDVNSAKREVLTYLRQNAPLAGFAPIRAAYLMFSENPPTGSDRYGIRRINELALGSIFDAFRKGQQFASEVDKT
ncbi:MAG: hypothetical protein IJY04_04695 [Clostridia bacterium]|nr:hypothetical protein [Clostridia bacterium]